MKEALFYPYNRLQMAKAKQEAWDIVAQTSDEQAEKVFWKQVGQIKPMTLTDAELTEKLTKIKQATRKHAAQLFFDNADKAEQHLSEKRPFNYP